MIKPTFYAGWPLLLCSQEVVLAPPPAPAPPVSYGVEGRCLPPGTRETGNGSVCGRHCPHQVGWISSRRGGNAVDAAVAVGLRMLR